MELLYGEFVWFLIRRKFRLFRLSLLFSLEYAYQMIWHSNDIFSSFGFFTGYGYQIEKQKSKPLHEKIFFFKKGIPHLSISKRKAGRWQSRVDILEERKLHHLIYLKWFTIVSFFVWVFYLSIYAFICWKKRTSALDIMLVQQIFYDF